MFSPSTALALAALMVAAMPSSSRPSSPSSRSDDPGQGTGRTRGPPRLAPIRDHGHLDSFLSANQLGITLASLALGWLGEPALASLIEPHVGSLAMDWNRHPVSGPGRGVRLISFVHAVLGELVPGRGLQKTEPVALWAAAPLRVFYLLTSLYLGADHDCQPLLAPDALAACLGGEMLHSPDELRLVLQHVDLDPGARRLIDRVFDYTHRVARHVDDPAPGCRGAGGGRTFAENVQLATANQYTRYPWSSRARTRSLVMCT